MISLPAEARQLIPRWRLLRLTIDSSELAVPKERHAAFAARPIPKSLEKKLVTWRIGGGIVAAAELVDSALAYGAESEALSAAKFLLRGWSGAAPLVLAHARKIVERSGEPIDPVEAPAPDGDDARGALRRVLRQNLGNPLGWVDLALYQAASGNKIHASRSLAVALKLAPYDRHVLRSAARFYADSNDVEHALHLIRRNEATPHDPWLIAAEVALSTKAQRTPLFVKRGITLIDSDKFNPRQITELAGAIATSFLDEGTGKKSKRLFKKSVADPTGNSLAQAEWASKTIGSTIVSDGQICASSDAIEARALRAYREGDFEAAYVAAKYWTLEEPNSVRAYSYAAGCAVVLERYEDVGPLAQRALKLDPKSGARFDNIFSLACLGHVDDAERKLNEYSYERGSDAYFIAEADKGLIAIKRGHFDLGRDYYRGAIEGFKRNNNLVLERLAKAYFAREAVRAGLPDAAQILLEAKTTALTPTNHDVASIIARAEALAQESMKIGGESAPTSPSPSAE
jgi:tetratricopeptide (TPR) repeat protein